MVTRITDKDDVVGTPKADGVNNDNYKETTNDNDDGDNVNDNGDNNEEEG